MKKSVKQATIKVKNLSNNFFILIFILISTSLAKAQGSEKTAIAAEKKSYSHEIHVFVPGVQYRYENDQDQSISNQQYRNYNLAGIIFDRYLVGAEFDEHGQDSASGSIAIKTQFQEFNLYFGYLIYSKTLHEEYKIIFDIEPVVYLGQNRTSVETTLNSISQKSTGENNLVYALGAQATLRIGFFILQPEFRYAYSRSYEPSYVPIFGGRIGFRIGL